MAKKLTRSSLRYKNPDNSLIIRELSICPDPQTGRIRDSIHDTSFLDESLKTSDSSKKKMHSGQKKIQRSSCPAVRSYTPPKLHTGKCWYVDFYAFDPASGAMRRKKFKLNNIPNKRYRRIYATDLMNRIFEELQAGWNPWIGDASGGNYATLHDACEVYEAYLSKLLQEDLLREKTCKGYRSCLKIMLEWNASNPRPKNYVYQIDHTFCVRFLDWLWLDKQLSSITRDNYLNWLKHFTKFLLEKQYINTDITAGISSLGKKKSFQKNRSIIAKTDMARLKEWCMEHNKHFLLACYILYYCFIRPKEMSFIQLKHISVQRGTIFIPDYSSKNRKDGTVTLPDKVLKLMVDLDTFRYPDSYYLFSDKLLPGKNRRTNKIFTDFWTHHIRKALHFPPKYKFYSLKDTGITDLIKANTDLLSVRNQARHHSLLMTDLYTPHDIEEADEVIRHHSGEF